MNIFSILRICLAGLVISSASAWAQTPRPPAPAPQMTEELMARLIIYTRASPDDSSISAKICKVLDLCDGTAAMPLRVAKSDATDALHYFALRTEANSRDVFFAVMNDKVIITYLTDKSAKLRAAAVLENGVARLITNEKAAAGFKAELLLFAKEAAEQLPPTR